MSQKTIKPRVWAIKVDEKPPFFDANESLFKIKYDKGINSVVIVALKATLIFIKHILKGY